MLRLRVVRWTNRTPTSRSSAAMRRLHAKQARGSRETARLDATSERHDIVEIKHLYQNWDDVFPL
jgi:hypothetical protein